METKELITKLLKSQNKEMCSLAITMFQGLTKNYADYYDIRMMYQPNGIVVVNQEVRRALNQMFNGLKKDTIFAYSKQVNKVLVPKGSHADAYRLTTLTSKQKRQKTKKDAQKRAKLTTD